VPPSEKKRDDLRYKIRVSAPPVNMSRADEDADEQWTVISEAFQQRASEEEKHEEGGEETNCKVVIGLLLNNLDILLLILNECYA